MATLGAAEGYLFVFSPFNCALRAPQIAALNALSERSRRSGRLLSIGHELADSAAARRATKELGIRLKTGPLATTRLGASLGTVGLTTPFAIAIRENRVVAVLSGADTQRIDSWLAWIEHRSPPPEA
ncbi:MAG TPA: hypothetical protein VFO55_14265 [Gemmatimonadaceae bacterium]|nr:hypothetical protein [Gemmatimonadaceae bacterium]